MKTKNYRTGYFADLNTDTERSKVHIVNESGDPICGTNISSIKHFHWTSTGVTLEYVECEKCRKAYEKLQATEIHQTSNKPKTKTKTKHKRTSSASLRKEYLSENGLKSFNKHNNNLYTAFLEQRIIKLEMQNGQ